MIKKHTKNYLLLKDDVGRPKPTTRDLPTYQHAYGHSAIPDKEGVGACKYYSIIIHLLLITILTQLLTV